VSSLSGLFGTEGTISSYSLSLSEVFLVSSSPGGGFLGSVSFNSGEISGASGFILGRDGSLGGDDLV
jgi:hypothetical protein